MNISTTTPKESVFDLLYHQVSSLCHSETVPYPLPQP